MSSCRSGAPCRLQAQTSSGLPRAAQHDAGMELASDLETSSRLYWSLHSCRAVVPKGEKKRSLSLWDRASEGPELLCQPRPT